MLPCARGLPRRPSARRSATPSPRRSHATRPRSMDDDADDKEVRGVGRRARRGLKWTLIGTAGANGLRVITIPILGRLLTPGQFGAVAAALTVILFGQMLRDIGLAPALIQRKSLAPEQ